MAEGLVCRETSHKHRHDPDLNPQPGGLKHVALTTVVSECPLLLLLLLARIHGDSKLRFLEGLFCALISTGFREMLGLN